MKNVRLVVVIFAPLVWAALVGAADAAAPTKDFSTARWKAKLPATWRLEGSCARGTDALPSTWTLSSPDRNLVFKVAFAPDAGAPVAELAAASLASLAERVLDHEVVKQETTSREGRDLFYAVVKGVMKRNKTHRDYLVWRLVTRSKSQKALVTLTLAASGERVDQLMELATAIMTTFDLVGSPAKAVRQ